MKQIELFSATYKIITVKKHNTLEAKVIYYFADFSALIRRGLSIFDYRAVKYYQNRLHISSLVQVKINSHWCNIISLDVDYFNINGHSVEYKALPLFNTLIKEVRT